MLNFITVSLNRHRKITDKISFETYLMMISRNLSVKREV